MKETRFAALPRLTVVTMLTVVLGGCWSSGPGSRKAEKRDPVPIPTSAISVQGQPGTFGGTLAVAVPESLSTFNPYVLSDPSTTEVLAQIYAPLVGFNPTTGKVLPQDGLAQSFEADGKKVTVRMREGLVFSDGTPIRADDVVYSLKVATDEQVHSPIADMLTLNGRLPEIALVDPQTLTLEFTEPYPAVGYVLSQLRVISAGADPEATINRGHYEEALGVDTPPARIACSGPFKVGTFEKGKRITLDYNPNYWKVDSQSLRLPYLDHMAFEFGLAPDEVSKRLENGSLGLAVDLDPTVFNGLGAGKGNCVTKDLGPGFGSWQMFGNMDPKLVADRVKTAWTRDPKFREFMSRIVDRDAIVKEVFAGKAAPAEGLVSPANATWHNGSVKKYPYDQTGALTALGDNYHVVERDGKPQLVDIVNRPIKLNLYYPRTPAGEGIQKIIADRFGKAGVPVKPVGVEPSKLLSQYLVTGKYEIALWRMDGFGPDPISYIPALMQNGTMHWYLHTDAGQQSPFDWETYVGRLMRSQQDKKLDADRQKDFNEVQKLWAENNPVTYIVTDNVLLAYDKQLGNFQPVAFRPYATWNAEQLFFKQ